MRELDINFIQGIKDLIKTARHNIIYAVNSEMVKTYFEIGKRIVEEEQKGSSRAEYGKKLIESLSTELHEEFGRGFNRTDLQKMRRFYLVYQKWGTVSPKLAWSHYCELIKIDDEPKRRYFENYAINEGLSVRDLKRQIYSLHYERLLMSKDKTALLEYEKKGNLPAKSDEVVKDPYVLEFLGMDEKAEYTEKELETRILDYLQKFLLELGQGFTFVARQKRFTIDDDNFYIDLLFYNIHLRCYVVIELKTTKFKHEDAGQMNFYLNYVKKELNREGDTEPIGIILCTQKDTVQVEFATAGISNKIFVSKYRFYLPTKEELESKVKKLL
ncbi:MAG: PDDEXK nuclease domain-containing protein [Candidatus Micrarchaeota archaeon]|nr:PDDEXK nuclease domain-containing protein [Candidatus Micrarchaeota archaeon]